MRAAGMAVEGWKVHRLYRVDGRPAEHLSLIYPLGLRASR
jgi:hypothetical protein